MKLLLSVIGLALATLRENKIRSFLTVLGVIIGTGTIIAVGSILAGLDGAVTGVIRSMGTNTAVVFKMRMGPVSPAARRGTQAQAADLRECADAIAERCPAVEHVERVLLPSPGGMGDFTAASATKATTTTDLKIDGTGAGYAYSGQAEMLEGRFFTESEDQHHMPVAVIGEDVYKALFGQEEPSGKPSA